MVTKQFNVKAPPSGCGRRMSGLCVIEYVFIIINQECFVWSAFHLPFPKISRAALVPCLSWHERCNADVNSNLNI